jgi:DeoR family transcriptional regulator of aga operon
MNKNESLLKIERQANIRKMVEEHGRVTVPELSAHFEVSGATIRRDLEELDGKGWVRRTHGGAVRAERASKEPPMMQRISENQTEKQRIGEATAKIIEEGQTIFLGSGTTVLEVARNLPEEIQLTVISNSLPVVNHLSKYPNVELIVIGGMLRHSELSMVGHIAEQAVREFRADKVILGMHGIDSHHGFTNDYLPETMTDRAILGIAPQVIVVADHTKFGRVSSVLVAATTVAHLIITDEDAPKDCIDELVEMGIEILQV